MSLWKKLFQKQAEELSEQAVKLKHRF